MATATTPSPGAEPPAPPEAPSRRRLHAGVREYRILDPKRRRMLVLRRQNDIREEVVVAAEETDRCGLLPGLEVRPADLIGPAEGAGDL